MRNFYIVGDIDGRQTQLAGGPRRKDGGMNVVIYQREQGAKVEALRISCMEIDGVLKTVVTCQNGFMQDQIEFVTER